MLVSHSLSNSRRSQGACERCYRNKERCDFDQNRRSCIKCQELGQECCIRQKKRMGRQPNVPQPVHGSCSVIDLGSRPKPQHEQASRSTQGPANIKTIFPVSPTELHAFRQVRHILRTKEVFFRIHQQCILGESFVDGLQTAVQQLFGHAPLLLTDAYSALLYLRHHQKQHVTRLDGLDFAKAIQGLQRLMHLPSSIHNVEDAAVLMLFGQIWLVYNVLLPKSSTSIITQGILLGVRRWLPALLQQPHFDAITLTPVFLDTVDCLLRRKLPVVRLPTTAHYPVDKSFGVCTSILPLLYDLSERSYEIKVGMISRRYGQEVGNVDPYVEIEYNIRSWTPAIPQDGFSPGEITMMLMQARLYRLAALLTIHRLRYPLGVKDDAALEYAKPILEQLETLKTWPRDGARVLGLDFPLLVAMVEIPDVGERIYRSLEPFRITQKQDDELILFVRYLQETRKSEFKHSWFDSTDDWLPSTFVA